MTERSAVDDHFQLVVDQKADQAVISALHNPPQPLVAFANEMARRSRERIADPASLHGQFTGHAQA